MIPKSELIKDIEFDVNGKPTIYENDKHYYQPNQILPRTKEHVEEIIKCKNDVVYFSENYCYIISLDKGEHIVELRDYQKQQLNMMLTEDFIVFLSSRQTGKCLWFFTKIKVRNKKTNKIKITYMGVFYWKIKFIKLLKDFIK